MPDALSKGADGCKMVLVVSNIGDGVYVGDGKSKV
jgi:hypothetical protein